MTPLTNTPATFWKYILGVILEPRHILRAKSFNHSFGMCLFFFKKKKVRLLNGTIPKVYFGNVTPDLNSIEIQSIAHQ